MLYWEESIDVLQSFLRDSPYPVFEITMGHRDKSWLWPIRHALGRWRLHVIRRRWRLERDACQDVWAQWIWFAFNIPADKIGFGPGPLTWARQISDRHRGKKIRICLLAAEHRGLPFGPLTVWAINRSSCNCIASLNRGLDQADIIWVYTQDPITPMQQRRIERLIACRAKSGAAVINPPASYNAFHQPGTFALLRAAGVRVPRSDFDDRDIGKTLVVYKTHGRQGAAKILAPYFGPCPGMMPFEFIENAEPDGSYCRYRVHYIAGSVRPSEVIVADQWNACLKNSTALRYTFTLSECETDQIKRIAQALQLQYFAVDFLRMPDGEAVFTDVNVYPTIQSPRPRVRARGDFGLWHTFDARNRLGLPEPEGPGVWELFDEAMSRLVADQVMSVGSISASQGDWPRA